MHDIETSDLTRTLAGAAPRLSPAARRRVRSRVSAGIAATRTPVPFGRRLGVALAGSVLALTTVSGVGMAAASSMPGDVLHPLKLAFERASVVFAPTSGLRSAAIRGVAAHRQSEAERLDESGEATEAAHVRDQERSAVRALPHLEQPVVVPAPQASVRAARKASARARALTGSGPAAPVKKSKPSKKKSAPSAGSAAGGGGGSIHGQGNGAGKAPAGPARGSGE